MQQSKGPSGPLVFSKLLEFTPSRARESMGPHLAKHQHEATMFKIQQSPSYLWPVTLPLVGEDGTVKNHEFHLMFKRLSSHEVTELQGRLGEVEDRALACEMVVGFGTDVVDARGIPLDISPDALTQLLNIHRVPYFIAKAFLDSLSAEVKEVAQEKN
jgi:hypothetical protein